MTKELYIEQIKQKYNQLENKMDFLMRLSQKTGLNFFSMKNHHFGNKWNIPNKYIDLYLKELDNELKKVMQ